MIRFFKFLDFLVRLLLMNGIIQFARAKGIMDIIHVVIIYCSPIVQVGSRNMSTILSDSGMRVSIHQIVHML